MVSTSERRNVSVNACIMAWFARSIRRAPTARAMTACIPTSKPIRAIMMRWPYA